MPATIVVGGQYGSEGKGKIAHFLAKTQRASFAVRCGGPNSGHTVVDESGKIHVFQQLPTATILPAVKLAVCAGSYIDLDILRKEIAAYNIAADRLYIDPFAVIITDVLKDREQQSGLISKIGSTGSGTGAAVAARVNREHDLRFAKDEVALKPFIKDVANALHASLENGERIILEGTQGFGLSPLHSGHYPKVTSRETTAAGVIAEAGISPLDVDDIALVIRAFPIRVAGDSGPLPNETTWEEVTKEGGFSVLIQERTTVTKKIRRVARFDPEVVLRAIKINSPTKIILNHADYLGGSAMERSISSIEDAINAKVDCVGISPQDLVKR